MFYSKHQRNIIFKGYQYCLLGEVRILQLVKADLNKRSN